MTPEDIKTRLKELNFTQADLANWLNIDTSAANRICNGGRTLKANEAEIIRSKLYPQSEPPKDDDINIQYNVIGLVQAGIWTDAVEIETADRKQISLPTGEHPLADKFFVLEACGDSMNKVGIEEGSYIVCLSIHDYDPDLASGDYVICQRTDGHGHYEATVKQLEIKDDGGHWLWPRSDNPEHQAPIKIPPPSEWPTDLDHCSSEEVYISAVAMTWTRTFLPL